MFSPNAFSLTTMQVQSLQSILARVPILVRRLRRAGLACLFCCFMAVGLLGCGFSAQESTAAPLKLTLWQGVNPPPNRDILQTLVDRFNQSHPNIQVESLYVGQPDQQMPKILAAVVGNAPPDLLWFNPTLTGQLIELEAIRPVDEWLARSPVKDQIDPALFSSMRYENQLWSMPFDTNNVGIFYRPSLFKAAGIETLPKTWDEFRSVAKRLTLDTNKDGRTDQHAIQLALGKGDFAVFTWLPFLWSAGGSLETAPNQATPPINLKQPGAIAALQFWQDLVKDGSAILSQPERGYELDNFLTGKTAMQISGPWTLGQLQQTGVDFGVFPMPTQAKSSTALGGENLFVLKTTPEREQAAFTFAEYAASEGFQTEWALGTGYLPVNLKSREAPEYKAFIQKQPSLKVFLDQMAVAQSRPIFPGYQRVSDALGRALEATLLGDRKPEAALQEAQSRIDLIFANTQQ
jgi:multiple sugar transport system substrate-binding protein